MKSDGMKRTAIILCGLAILAGCAKKQTENINKVNRDVLEAWLAKNYPGVTASGPGIYILEDVPPAGEAREVGTEGWVYADYTTTGLDGSVTNTTSEEIARKVKTFSNSKYYGPVFQSLDQSVLPVGIEAMLSGMKVGGRRKAVIPAWLVTTERQSSADKYLDASTEESTQIYDLTITDYTSDVYTWQKDKISEHFASLYGAADPVEEGFWYHQLKAPDNTEDYSADAELYINYIGRYLNGKVFDTNIRNVARDAGIENSSTVYKPAKISWASEYTDIKMTTSGSSTSSSIISGFALTLWQMHPHEKGVGMFWSNLGYGDSGQSGSIPAYCPLVFEVEIVDNQ